MDAGVGAMPGGDGSTGGIMAVRRAVVISVPPPYVTRGEPYSYVPQQSDPGKTTWSVRRGPPGLTFSEGRLQADADTLTAGAHEVEIEGQAGDATVIQRFSLRVADTKNRASGNVAPTQRGQVTVESPTSPI
jgi:hypothetical protein